MVQRPLNPRVAVLGAAAVFALSALAACGTSDIGRERSERDGTRPQQDETGTPDDGSPLTALPPCGPPPSASASAADVPGLVLPAEVIITLTRVATPELVEVRGYIATTPIRVRQFYEQEPDLTILSIEDEIFEAEVLVERGAYRTYMKANAACSDASTIYAMVGPAGSGAVPTPTGP